MTHPTDRVCLPHVFLQQDTRGLGVVILTALTEEQWVEEDEFARKLNLPPKVVRKAMRFLEQVSCCCLPAKIPEAHQSFTSVAG